MLWFTTNSNIICQIKIEQLSVNINISREIILFFFTFGNPYNTNEKWKYPVVIHFSDFEN